MARFAPVPLAVLACAALAFAGCSSSEDDQAPSACLAGPNAYIAALQSAPSEVRLDGDTPISECLTPEQEGGELAQVGKSMIEAATQLNSKAQGDPDAPEVVQLGYLTGAVERGADSIHADLVRRLSTAAQYSESGAPSAEFVRTFGEGYAAGKETG